VSLDDRLRNGLASLVEDVRDPDASAERVRVSSRMRTRRRRTFAVAGGLLLAVGGAVLAADGDDDTPARVAGVTIAAPTTAVAPGTTAAPTAPTTAPAATSAPTTTPPTTPPTSAAPAAPTTSAAVDVVSLLGCGVPLLPTALPEGFSPRLVANPHGAMDLRGASGRTLVLAPSVSAPASPAGTRTLELPALGSRAAVAPAVDGVTVAEFAVSARGCAPTVRVLTTGLAAAELDRVLLGLRPDRSCSSSGVTFGEALAGEVPGPVITTRAALRDAAKACDFVALARAVPASGVDVPGVRREDQWRVDEGAGRTVLRTVATLLEQAPRRVEPGLLAGAPSFVWPASAGDPAVPLSEVPAASTDARDLFVEIRASDGAVVALRTR
jgi:hypothetical protein